MKKTFLYDEHKKLGAKLVPFSGFEMPVQYKGVKEEVLATRNSAGLFDISHMGEFWLEGKETYKFLDHLLTNDISKAEMSKAVYSPLCRPDGTVIDDLIVYKISSELAMLCVNAGNIKKDWDWIKKQSEKFAVSLIDKSEETSLIAIQGPDSVKIMSQLNLNMVENLEYYSCHYDQDSKILIARTGYTGEDGFEIFATHETIKSLWQKCIELKVLPCGLAARDVLRLEVCFPLYGHELHDDVTPLDSALNWTVKTDKRDFIGKDALDSYRPKYKLLKLSIEKGIPRQDYKILNKSLEIIGHITSGTYSPTLEKGIALAHVDANKYGPKEELLIAIRNKNILAAKHTKPFVSGGHI